MSLVRSFLLSVVFFRIALTIIPLRSEENNVSVTDQHIAKLVGQDNIGKAKIAGKNSSRGRWFFGTMAFNP